MCTSPTYTGLNFERSRGSGSGVIALHTCYSVRVSAFHELQLSLSSFLVVVFARGASDVGVRSQYVRQ